MRTVRRLIIGVLGVVGVAAAAGFAVRRLVREFGTEEDDTFSIVASMTERRFHGRADSLRSGSATAVMGSVFLDLRDAHLEGLAMLHLAAVMGGMEVIVPGGWRVEVAARVVMGDLVDRTNPDDLADGAPLLLVDAIVVMGGVIIHTGKEA